jgi:hypothetical protein
VIFINESVTEPAAIGKIIAEFTRFWSFRHRRVTSTLGPLRLAEDGAIIERLG